MSEMCVCGRERETVLLAHAVCAQSSKCKCGVSGSCLGERSFFTFFTLYLPYFFRKNRRAPFCVVCRVLCSVSSQ